MEIIREGRWICPNCALKNKGGQMTCPGCGATRPGDVEFIYEEDAEEITDQAEIKKATVGPDWACTYCGVSNAFAVHVCKGCSAQRSDGKAREVKNVPLSSSKPDLKSNLNVPPPPIRPPGKPQVPGCAKFGCGGMFLLFVLLMIIESMDYPQAVEVIARNWSRTVAIQEYKTVRHSDWLDQLPKSGRIVGKSQKIRSYKQVLTGYRTENETYSESVKVGTKKVKAGVKDLGNGRFQETWRDEPVYERRTKTRKVEKPVYRQDPIYDTMADYDLDEWIETERPSISGTEEEPSWPDRGLSDSAEAKIGNRKVNFRSENYRVTLQSVKDSKKFDTDTLNEKKIDLGIFKKLKKGSKFEAVVSGLGNLKSVKIE